MAEQTTAMELGFKASPFTLPDTVSGKQYSIGQEPAKATVVMFICNHCPYVKHVIHELISLANTYQPKGIHFLAISSNDVANYPDDSPENMNAWAKELSFPFPYLYDETQDVARAYDAACTPDFSIFDANLRCVYRGRLDDSSPSNGKPLTGADLRAALDAILSGKPLSDTQHPSIGCGVKWKQ